MAITIEKLRALQPIFAKNNPSFLRAYSDSDDEPRLAAWLPVALGEFPLHRFEDDAEATIEYAQSLWLAHLAELWLFPRWGLLPPRITGDQPSASLSEGSVSVSWQRQSYREFMAPVQLAYTNAGSELAEMLRARNESIFVL